MVERVRSLADGPIDHVLGASRPNVDAIAALMEITGDPKRVVTISKRDEARSQGARGRGQRFLKLVRLGENVTSPRDSSAMRLHDKCR